MQFKKYAILLAALVTSPVGAVINEATASQVAQLTSNFKDLDSKVAKVSKALENYKGGLLGALQVANAVHGAHKATTAARKNVDESGDFNKTEGAQAVAAYSDLHPRLLDVLQVAKEKVCFTSHFSSIRPGREVGIVAYPQHRHRPSERLAWGTLRREWSPTYTWRK